MYDKMPNITQQIIKQMDASKFLSEKPDATYQIMSYQLIPCEPAFDDNGLWQSSDMTMELTYSVGGLNRQEYIDAYMNLRRWAVENDLRLRAEKVKDALKIVVCVMLYNDDLSSFRTGIMWRGVRSLAIAQSGFPTRFIDLKGIEKGEDN